MRQLAHLQGDEKGEVRVVVEKVIGARGDARGMERQHAVGEPAPAVVAGGGGVLPDEAHCEDIFEDRREVNQPRGHREGIDRLGSGAEAQEGRCPNMAGMLPLHLARACLGALRLGVCAEMQQAARHAAPPCVSI